MDVLLEESSLMEMTIERRSDVSPAAVPMLAEEEPQHVEQDETISGMYSLVLSKSYYYTVAQQLQIVPSANTRPVILPADDVKFYAVSVCCSFPNYVATLVDLSCGNLLYICIYNPMTDPPLSALRELLLSAQKEKPISWLLYCHRWAHWHQHFSGLASCVCKRRIAHSSFLQFATLKIC